MTASVSVVIPAYNGHVPISVQTSFYGNRFWAMGAGETSRAGAVASLSGRVLKAAHVEVAADAPHRSALDGDSGDEAKGSLVIRDCADGFGSPLDFAVRALDGVGRVGFVSSESGPNATSLPLASASESA